MSKIVNEENEWDKIADADTVKGPIQRVLSEEIMEAFKHLKIATASGPIEIYAGLMWLLWQKNNGKCSIMLIM